MNLIKLKKRLQTLFGIIVIVMISIVFLGFEINQVFAEETKGYLMAEDINAHVTFKFRDGVETHEFPVFKSSDFVANEGTSFEVQGVVSNAPYLHKALDEAFKFRFGSFDYNYKYFDIDVEFNHASGEYDVFNFQYTRKGGDDALVKDDEPRKTIHYTNCQIADYLVDTQPTADGSSYRPYSPSETGFAIVETIEFQCGGTHSDVTNQSDLSYSTGVVNDFGKLGYKYADDVRTFVTFEFDYGIERIEFPIFKTISGFGEDGNPKIHLEGVPNRYPLLSSAIDNARDNQNHPGGSNVDFNAKVEFVQETLLGEEKLLLREIYYEDCSITGSDITTYYDHEEGFVGAGGFAMVQTIDFDCAGIIPLNPRYDVTTRVSNEQFNHNYNMATGPHAIAEFKFKDNTIETIDFPIFRQQGILSESSTTFELAGMVGNSPLLYKQVDADAEINQGGGDAQSYEYFDVDVTLQSANQTIRGFSYSDCHVADYVVATQQQNEEGFWAGFALENTFEFECIGYHPKNPVHDTMFEVAKSNTTSTLDLPDTSTWADEFK